jgi:hypothetical protein
VETEEIVKEDSTSVVSSSVPFGAYAVDVRPFRVYETANEFDAERGLDGVAGRSVIEVVVVWVEPAFVSGASLAPMAPWDESDCIVPGAGGCVKIADCGF